MSCVICQVMSYVMVMTSVMGHNMCHGGHVRLSCVIQYVTGRHVPYVMSGHVIFAMHYVHIPCHVFMSCHLCHVSCVIFMCSYVICHILVCHVLYIMSCVMFHLS
jgi:hypothetical protein